MVCTYVWVIHNVHTYVYVCILCVYVHFIIYVDIDECIQGLDGCDHNCTNTVGSYNCTCMDGYVLEADNHTCIGKDQYVCRITA